MKYQYPETLQFWRIGQKLFHGRFLRCMSGPKNQGQILQGATYRGLYDPQESTVNFAVPSTSILRKMNPFEKDSLKPGMFDTILSNLAELDNGNTYKLAVDAKKISKGRGKIMGDVDLFGFEQISLTEKQEKKMTKKARVTGSTINAALGLDTLKRQQEHFDAVFHGSYQTAIRTATKQYAVWN